MRGFTQRHYILLYGLALAALLFILKWLELRLLVYRNSFEYYGGAIALIFLGVGIWIASQGAKKHHPLQNIPQSDAQAAAKLGITTREIEVLALMAAGLSNQEIADKLFVTINTIKTHNAKLFEKLGVSRRTQAVEKAKRLGIIA